MPAKIEQASQNVQVAPGSLDGIRPSRYDGVQTY